MPTLYEPTRRATPKSGKYARVMSSMRGQGKRTQICPDSPRLDGKIALVTGGTGGIGAEVVRGLATRGADVIVAARGGASAEKDCAAVARETGRDVSFLRLDLASVQAVRESVAALGERLGETHGGRPLDIVCANAGMSPHAHSTSIDGHEQAFAVNCLGHHVLIRTLMDNHLLAQGARIVATTGDIYILSENCTPDFTYRGRGVMAYARSKLGNVWQFSELAWRHPELEVVLVHPGVVASGLEGSTTGVVGFVKRLIMASPAQGAQASLIGATQDLPSGTYFHNMNGVMDLREGDPARDGAKAAAFWDTLEVLSARKSVSAAA
ncbi:MAG: SDR family NAD(P)-dependent oxidoreductase [Candidatus Phaeomarinobacter sp.]